MTAISIEVNSTKTLKAIERLLKAGELPEAIPVKTWEDLTADDYRMMIKMQVPTIKAKSFRNYGKDS